MAKVRRWMVCASMFWISVGSPRRRIDREHRDVVLAALEHLLAADLLGAGVAVGHVDEPAVRMDVDGAGHLRVAVVGAVGERVLDEHRRRAAACRRR